MQYDWKDKDEFIKGVEKILECSGDMFDLEIQVHEDNLVTGVVYRNLPATYWEPPDWVMVLEEVYPSVDVAKAALEKVDIDATRYEQELDRMLDECKSEADSF